MSGRVAIVTTGRADYGLLRPLLSKMRDDVRFDSGIIVTGSHLVAGQGMTVNEIEADGHTILARVRLADEGDSRLAMAHATGSGMSRLADVMADSMPDVIVILGDRFEAFAAAAAAAILDIPIAHIHGGELTSGSLDDSFRHAITKLATLHLTSTAEYRKRVIQMGQAPFTVFDVGALAVDVVRGAQLLDAATFEKTHGVACDSTTLLVTYHPVTKGGDSVEELRELLGALDNLPGHRVLFTAPNLDAGGREVRMALDAWVSDHAERAQLVPSLGSGGYLSAAHNAAAVVGNSSSGLIEIPALGVPSVDIGNRQEGRIHPPSVVHAESDSASIVRAIEHATSPEHRALAATAENPYGDGHTTEKIVRLLGDADLLLSARTARFVDLECKEPS